MGLKVAPRDTGSCHGPVEMDAASGPPEASASKRLQPETKDEEQKGSSLNWI